MLDKSALIIDDSATARTMLKHKLKKFDVVVESAVDGFEALQLLQNRQPDIIFLDHIMPGMDGFQVLEQLKNNPLTRSIPVIMYTSQAAPKYTDEARTLGAIGVMPKQVTHELLSQMLDRAEQYHQGALHSGEDKPQEPVFTEAQEEAESEHGAVGLAEEPLKEDSATNAEVAVNHSVSQPSAVRKQPSYIAILAITGLLLTQLYWFYRDQQQQLMISSLTQQLQQQELAYQQAVDELIDLRTANQISMDQFQFVMDALVSQVLDQASPVSIASVAAIDDSEAEIERQQIGEEAQ